MVTVGNAINLATSPEYFANLKSVFNDVSKNEKLLLPSTSLVKGAFRQKF